MSLGRRVAAYLPKMRKAIAAGSSAGIAAVGVAMPGGLTDDELWAALGVALVALAATWRVPPNAPDQVAP